MAAEIELFSPATAQALLILSAGAFTIPLICRPIRMPASVGEILFGVVVGPHMLGLVQASDFIHLMAHLGFFLLMFIAGFELNFSRLEKGGLTLLGRGLAWFLVNALVCLGIVMALGWPPFLVLVLSAISIGVTLMLLHESHLGAGDFGQHIMFVGSIGEFCSILAVTFVNAWSHAGGLNRVLVFDLMGLALVIIFAHALLVVFRTLVWWRSDSFARVIEFRDPSEIGVRAGLALMFVMVAVTSALRLDPILGAFLAGALFSFVFRHKGPLEVKFLSIGNGFLIPFFFISVGLGFNLPLALEGSAILLLQMLTVLFLARWLAFAVVPGPGFNWKVKLAGSIILSAPLTLLVLIANLGLHLRMIDEAFHSTIVLLAVISATLYPYLFGALARWVHQGSLENK